MPVITAANPLFDPFKIPLSNFDSWIQDITANIIPNEDKKSQSDFFML